MSITRDYEGFNRLSMKSDNNAQLYADIYEEFMFEVYLESHREGDSWCFDKKACEEAIVFFTMLRDELARREKE